jgi:hypothetical protein
VYTIKENKGEKSLLCIKSIREPKTEKDVKCSVLRTTTHPFH